MIGPLAYIGGKRRLAPTIIKLLPQHITYVEPFAGGAQVFFHKQPSKVEVLNDRDSEIVNFLRICQHHHDELARWLKWSVASRKIFQIFSELPATSLTDVQRAARFLYLQKNCFGGRRHSRAFHFAVTKRSNYSPERLPHLLAKAAHRLARVQIECSPYEQILARYDRPTTLFYCDPPYQGLKLYEWNLPDSAFIDLAERLSQIRGKFILSINDTPFIRRVFSGFHCREVAISYSSSRVSPRVTELLYGNFELPKDPTQGVPEQTG